MSYPLKADRVLGIIAGLLFLLAVFEVSVSTVCSGLGSDSAVYVSAGWAHVLGHKLYQEVICSYPPGVPVIVSILGKNVCNPQAVHGLLFLTHFINCICLYGIIRSLGLGGSVSCFLTSIFLTHVLHLDGFELVLEPFQNLFILAAFYTYRRYWTPASSLLAGCLVTLSVMMKQFSVLYIPIFCYAAWSGALRKEQPESQGTKTQKRNLILFLLGMFAPYSVYVILDNQNFLKLLIHLATFGGSAYYKGQGAIPYASLSTPLHPNLLDRTTATLVRFLQPTYMLVPGFIFLVALLKRGRSQLSNVVCCLFVASLIPMLLNGFLHYAQLAAPWQILMAALLLAELSPEKPKERMLIASLLLISMSPFIYINLKIARHEWNSPSLSPQFAMARVVQDIVPEGQTILLEGLGYLYPLAQRIPPDWNFEAAFYDGTQSDADFLAVFSPGLDSDDSERREIARVLAAGRFAHLRTERYDDKAFRVGRVIFFRRSS